MTEPHVWYDELDDVPTLAKYKHVANIYFQDQAQRAVHHLISVQEQFYTEMLAEGYVKVKIPETLRGVFDETIMYKPEATK